MATKTFIGRDRETAILTDAVHEVTTGRGRLVLLCGEPGIGKTRLAEETARSAAALGARVLWGRCWEGGGAPPFWPWIQLIRGSLAGGAWSDAMLVEAQPGLTLIAQMVPELRSALPLRSRTTQAFKSVSRSRFRQRRPRSCGRRTRFSHPLFYSSRFAVGGHVSPQCFQRMSSRNSMPGSRQRWSDSCF